jgi:hypothetical protein
MYFECFVLVLSVNFVYNGNFLSKYAFTYVGVTYVDSRPLSIALCHTVLNEIYMAGISS